MKKFTLLSAVLVAGMATAQVAQVAPEQMNLQQMNPQSIQMNKEISLKDWTGYSKKVANASYDLETSKYILFNCKKGCKFYNGKCTKNRIIRECLKKGLKNKE